MDPFGESGASVELHALPGPLRSCSQIEQLCSETQAAETSRGSSGSGISAVLQLTPPLCTQGEGGLGGSGEAVSRL